MLNQVLYIIFTVIWILPSREQLLRRKKRQRVESPRLTPPFQAGLFPTEQRAEVQKQASPTHLLSFVLLLKAFWITNAKISLDITNPTNIPIQDCFTRRPGRERTDPSSQGHGDRRQRSYINHFWSLSKGPVSINSSVKWGDLTRWPVMSHMT